MWDITDILVKLKITFIVVSIFAFSTTVLRLYLRRGNYWWDDAWATFAVLLLFVQAAGVFMHAGPPENLSWLSRVAAYYIMAITFYTIIWVARLSILFSVIRISADEKMRRRLSGAAVIFILTNIVLVCQLFWVCEPKASTWKNNPIPQCELTKQVVILQIISDVLSDLLLLVAPLRILVGLRSDNGLRRRLQMIFSTSIVTTIVSLVHAAYIFDNGRDKEVIAAMVEDCVSLIICNLPVLAAATLKRQRKGRGEDDPSDDPGAWTDYRINSSRSRGRSRETKSQGGPTFMLTGLTTNLTNFTMTRPGSFEEQRDGKPEKSGGNVLAVEHSEESTTDDGAEIEHGRVHPGGGQKPSATPINAPYLP